MNIEELQVCRCRPGASRQPAIDRGQRGLIVTGGAAAIPRGSDHQAMHDQPQSAFEEIADARPLLLVK
jgi:hypothetical protein